MAVREAAPEPWTDKDGKPIVGFCIWCNIDFYTMDEVWAHNADNSAACPEFQKFIKERATSPSMPEDAEPLDDGEPG